MTVAELSREQAIAELVKMLRTARREGAPKDEPEGARCIWISDTLALQFADRLEKP